MASNPPLVGAIPFVGRGDELNRLVASIRAGVTAFVIAGPAGAGKSRLAAEVATTLASHGFVTERLIATRAIASVPFGAFVPVLGELTSGDRFSMLRDAAAAIAQRGGSSRFLITVEDAHLLDDGSAALLLQLVQGGQCAVVVTLRTPAQTPGPVTELWKDQLAERLDLAPLTAQEVEQIAVEMVGGPVSTTLARWLVQASGGNPMYVRELLIGAAERTALFRQEGLWFARLPFPAPERLAELVASRLETFSDAAMEVVDLLAIGEPLPFALLEGLAGHAAVEEAESAGIVELADAGAGTARLSHPLYSDVRRQRMPHTRLRRLAQALVDQYPQASSATSDDVIRVARWQLEAGGVGNPDVFAGAAAQARRLFDLDLAVTMGRSALEAGAGPLAALTIAEAYFFSGRSDEAEAVLAEAAQQCQTDEELARITHARVYNLGLVKGDLPAAEAVLEMALPKVTDSAARERLTVSKVTLRVWSRQCPSVLDEAIMLSRATDGGVADRGLFFASIISATRGELTAAKELATEGGSRLADKGGAEGSHNVGMVLALRAEGGLIEAEDVIAPVYDLPPSLERTATHLLLHGMVLIERGFPTRALQMFRDALAINRELDDTGPLRWCLGGVALASALCGNRRAARSALVELDERPPHVMALLDDELIGRSRAWLTVAEGDIATAKSVLLAVADQAGSDGRLIAEMFLRHDVARLGYPHLVADRLGELAELVDGQLVGVMAQHARAAANGDRADLETAANLFEQLGATLLAAEIGATVADQFLREGDDRQAMAWGNHVDRLRQQCGPVHTPALDHRAGTSPLTVREHEIAALAARGVSSREIAAQLVLSVRTVENHLGRVYTKLGVSGREELQRRLPGTNATRASSP